MKKISFWFVVSFSFFVIGELFWSIRLCNASSIFVTEYINDWILNIMFILCSLTGLTGSYKWYKKC